MSDLGFKVSLPGFDVKTATPEQCSVHSSYPPLKAKTNQPTPHVATLDVDFTAKITQNSTQTVFNFTHGYSYVPVSIASIIFRSHDGTTVVGLGSAGVGANLAISADCTSSVFRVTIYDNASWTGSAARLRVSYYVFAENGT